MHAGATFPWERQLDHAVKGSCAPTALLEASLREEVSEHSSTARRQQMARGAGPSDHGRA